jgi:regulator of protease activity HflC (stomatin/prohibitin superfamily)
MRANNDRGLNERAPWRPDWAGSAKGLAALAGVAVLSAIMMYNQCKIEVSTGQQAVLIRKTGADLKPDMELAPAPSKSGQYSKGVQPGVLTEGRYFYNPYFWSWEIKPQFLVPEGKCGVRIALVGKPLPPGGVLAGPGEKGIVPGVLEPGARVPYNWYAEQIELHDPVTIPPGSRGVVTLVAGQTPRDPNAILVGPGERGVQKETLPPGTYFINPYEKRVSVVDCRSKRFNLGQGYDMDFLSSDGFVITLDGVVEFRVMPERASEVFVLYNEDHNGDAIDEEIIAKVITPESRSISRIGGSKLTGGQFISGDDRLVFQRDLERALKDNCKKQGIEILNVSITSIEPPQEIAGPIRDREVAKQQLARYQQEKLQQLSEAQLKVQQLLANQKKELVEAEQQVVEQVTMAEQKQQVAVTLAEQKLKVAETQLQAAANKALAITAEAQAAADVIRFKNTAELAGLAARVQAFDGDGSALAQNILVTKLAPAYRSILTNSESPLMDLFGQFSRTAPPARTAGPPLTTHPRAPRHNQAEPAQPASGSSSASHVEDQP